MLNPVGCVPETTIAKLQEHSMVSEMLFPPCMKVERCSGCCPSKRLQCVPVNTSFEDVSVRLIWFLQYTESNHKILSK